MDLFQLSTASMSMLVAPAKLVILIRRNHGCDVSVAVAIADAQSALDQVQLEASAACKTLRAVDVYRKSTRHRRATKRATLKSDEMT